MKKTEKKPRLSARLKVMDKKHWLAIALLLLSASLPFFRYRLSLERLITSCIDLGLSVVCWFCYIFDISTTLQPTVTDLSRIDISTLPYDLEAVEQKIITFGISWYRPELLAAYNAEVMEFLHNSLLFVSFLLPIIVVVFCLIGSIIYSENKRPIGKKTKALCFVLWSEKRFLHPIVCRLKAFFDFFFKNTFYKRTFLIVWLLNTNLITIGLGAIAYYYYFLMSTDLAGLIGQLVKLILDGMIMWSTLPAIVWFILFYKLFDAYRRQKGYEELQHLEAKNCGFLKSTALISNVVGAPGVGKTTFVADAGLSWVNIFKQETKELLLTDMLTFPEFPFLRFENELCERIARGEVFNTPAAERFAKGLWDAFAEAGDDAVLYGYDSKRYGLERNLGNRIETLENTLKEHAKAYFIYLCENPSLSNFPIRFDGHFDGSKSFPLWKNDFFRSSPESIKTLSVYSHVLDQDLMRMGKTVKAFNPRAGTFGFGIYTNTEWGKSRGNQLTLRGVKKKEERANQLNDLYEYSHKMCRHASTMVRGKVFFRFLGDEQRARTLGVDLRDLCSILTIMSRSELYLVMPYFILGDMLYKWLYSPLLKAYERLINLRGDETVFSYLMLKKPLSLLSLWYKRIYNTFGVYEQMIKKEEGTSYGDTPEKTEAELHSYYLMLKKIYADRFNSDCYEGFFSKRQLECGEGINDLPCFDSLDMTTEQMEDQNDFFLMNLMQIFADEEATSAPAASSEAAPMPVFNLDEI